MCSSAVRESSSYISDRTNISFAPTAGANVIALSDRADLLTLSFGVTWWDHLGWRVAVG
jgi:hypothetical protein